MIISFFKDLIKNLNSRPFLKKILNNIGWLTIDQIIRFVISLTVGIWVARYLGPTDFGLMNFAIAFVSILSTFSGLGISSIVLRDFIKYENKTNIIFGTAFLLKFIASLICLIGSLVIVLFLMPGEGLFQVMVLLLSISLVFNSSDIIGYFFESRMESKFSLLAQTTSFVLVTLLKVYLILYSFSVIYFILTSLIEAILVASIFVLVYKERGFKFNWKFDFNFSKSFLREGFFLLLSGVSAIIYMKIDQVMIGFLLSNYEVGIYSVAVRLGEIGYIFPALILSSLFPVLVKYQGKDLFKKRLIKLSSFMTWVALGGSLAILFFSKNIILFLYGVDYLYSAEILNIYILASVFVFFGYVANKVLIIEGLSKIILFKEGLGAILNISLNLILIPNFGIMGAAYATVISYSIAFVFSLVLFKKTRFLIKIFFKSFNPFSMIEG
jgi:polysaccharide transporter, PST family